MKLDGMLNQTVFGMRELNAQLEALGAELGLKTLAAAARKAFKPVLEAAIANAPVDSGLLRDNIKLKVEKPKSGDSVVVVGLRIAKAKTGRTRKDGKKATSPDWRWHFIELGRPAYGKGAEPFLRPALDANAKAVVETLKDELQKGIARALKKQARDAKKAALAKMRGGALGLDLSGGIA